MLLALLAVPTTLAQKFDPPATKSPDEKTLDQIKQRIVKLQDALTALPSTTPEFMRSDVEIYLKAAEWIVRHEEWFHADSGKWTLAVLDQGLQRASDAAKGKAPWRDPAGKTVSFAYRSKVDGSVQPYAVTYPLDYGKDPKKKWRLDVVLHGRDSTLCEVKFLNQHNGKAVPKDQDFVMLEIYGRGNNAYRWAGETDVFEAMEHFIATEKLLDCGSINRSKIVLRGFSMGGAGTWHIGLHHPDKFCAIGPGAGFTNTHGYIKNLPNPLPDYQEKLLHIYDAVDYAENAFNVPIVAYSGEKDPQKAAADNIEKRLKDLKIDTMTHLIAPGLEHQFPAEWQRKAQAEFGRYADRGKPGVPERISFSTFTLKYSRCGWIQLEELEKHYELASVDGQIKGNTITLRTKNVRCLAVHLTQDELKSINAISIDGQSIGLGGHDYEKNKGKWRHRGVPPTHPFVKFPNMQGPIDDAFTSAFLCVTGTGKPWHDAMNNAAMAQLQRFEKEWDKWMRGKLPVKTDKEVTQDDIKTKHLILFGDPASNSLIAKVVTNPFSSDSSNLPIPWNRNDLAIGGQRYDSSKHLPILIYPNPMNEGKYIVLNSGHTFHDAEFKGTNALLYPRLGDYAVVRPLPTEKDPSAFEVIKAGIFDDVGWKISEK